MRLTFTTDGFWTNGLSIMVAISLRNLVDTATLEHEVRSSLTEQ